MALPPVSQILVLLGPIVEICKVGSIFSDR